MMKIKIAILLLIALSANKMFAQNNPALAETDRIRLAEAYRIADQLGDKVWRDWRKVPFAVLLVTPEYEFLIRHPKPSKDFKLIGYDALLKSDVYYRPRVFQTNLLATMPAVGGISTIVVGQAENTDKKTSTPWVITLLHEHFHQLQVAKSDYYSSVAALDLAGDDQTGMWMLNYNFPYTDEKTAQIYAEMAIKLREILAFKTPSKAELNKQVKDYLALRETFKQTLSLKDYKYFSFQIWQEGVARYTEYRIADLAARKYKPSAEFKRLKDFQTFKNADEEIRQTALEQLTSLSLTNWKRVAFYPLGAGEGLLLDKVNPGWRDQYFTERFYLEKYFDNVR